MTSKNEAKSGGIVINILSAISLPVKGLGLAAGVAGLGYGSSYVQNLNAAPPTQRVENVQVADKATTDKLDKILDIVQETAKEVGKNTSAIEAVGKTQDRMIKRIDKNEMDIERLERKE